MIIPVETASPLRAFPRPAEEHPSTSTEVATDRFDYAQIDVDVAAAMRAAADRVCGLMRASVIEVGRELLAIKRKLKHGQFVPWVERECRLSMRVAQRAMQAAEMVEKNDKLSYLPPDGLLALASRSASEPIVAEIIEQIETGAQPTAVDIKCRIAAAVREARAGRLGQTPAREEPSPDDQLAALLDAWERAGCEVRGGFLDRIGAVLAAAAQIEEPQQQLPASSVPRVAGPEQLDDDVQTITARIAEPEQLPAASPSIVAPTSGCEETGVENATSPLTEEQEQHPAASAGPIVATSASWNVGDPQVPEPTRLNNKSGVGSTSPPEVTCHGKDGACRYGGCARSGRCLHEPGHQRAAA